MLDQSSATGIGFVDLVSQSALPDDWDIADLAVNDGSGSTASYSIKDDADVLITALQTTQGARDLAQGADSVEIYGVSFQDALTLNSDGFSSNIAGVNLSIRLLDPLDNPSSTLSVAEATAVNNASVINKLATYDIRDDFDNIDTTATIMGNATQVVATNIDSLDDMRAAFNDTVISSFEFSQSFVDGGGLNNISVADSFYCLINIFFFLFNPNPVSPMFFRNCSRCSCSDKWIQNNITWIRT